MNIDLIISLCQKGQRKAQAQLYDAYADMLYRIAYRYVHNKTDAEDILQEAFLRIYTNIDKFDKDLGSFKSWASRITVNECLSFLKRRNRIDTAVITTDMEDIKTQTAAVSKLVIEEILSTIEKMSEQYRVIMMLHFVEGYSHHEIAELLGIKSSSSRSRLSRARDVFKLSWSKLSVNHKLCE